MSDNLPLEPIATIPTHCVERLREPSVLLTEERSDVVILNPHQFFVDCVSVDGCVINDGRRCDWLLLVGAGNASYLIELKGSDVDSAMQQLEIAYARLATHLLKNKYWIISHAAQPRSTTLVADLQREKRKQGIRLLTSESPFILTI